jgi:hypothetical protein
VAVAYNKKGSSIFLSDETGSRSPKSKGTFKSVRDPVPVAVSVDTRSLLSKTQGAALGSKQKKKQKKSEPTLTETDQIN